LVSRWNDSQEESILHNIENLNKLNAKKRIEIVNYIVSTYMRLKSIKFDLRNGNDVSILLQKIINEPDFREFTFNKYHVFIYQGKKTASIHIDKISDEILLLIHNRGTLTDDQLLDKVKMITRTKFFERKKQHILEYFGGLVGVLTLMPPMC
jgi:capsule polysaccharide export protein KpsC/LpsZ